MSDTRAHIYTQRDRYTHLPSPQRWLGTLSGAPVVGYWLLCSWGVPRVHVCDEREAVLQKKFG